MPRVLLSGVARLFSRVYLRLCAAYAFGLLLVLSCLLLFAGGANAQYVPGDQGAVYILAPTDTINGPVTEGVTINIKVRGYRYTNSRDRTFHLSYRVDDDPALDLIDAKHEGLQKHQFNVGGSDAPGVFDARGDANATLSIPTKPDARCRDGNITVTLLGSYHPLPRFVLDVAPKEYTSQLGSGSITIRVKDDPRRCPTISLDRTSAEALERDGVIEGGALEFHVARQINSGKGLDGGQVTAKWNVEDDATLDFLASADQGEKSHQFEASKVKRRQTKYVRIQTRVDRGAGNGSVKVTLQPSEYYKLTGKTTLTVPVKDDTDFLKRVLRISDLTVAEDDLYLDSTLNFINGFRLLMQLGGSPGTSAQDPSVRVSFVEGGGCVATADAQDLSKPGGDGRRVPRTSFPQPMVIEWERERPDARSRHFIRSLMNDQYHEGDETLCVRFDQPKFLRLPSDVDEYFATITITDDDPPPSIQVDTPSAAEGDGALDFTVTLTNPPQGKDVTVKYHDTRRGSATSGDDYQALPKASAKGVLTFPADKGDTPQESTVSVRIIDDAEVEDEEDVVLRFTEPQNADFKSGARGITAIGFITDNETQAPQVRLREAAPGAGPVVVQEGQTAVFHADTYIYKDGKWQIGTIEDQVLIRWEVTPDQGSGGAVNRRDFPASFNRFDNNPQQTVVINGRNGESGIKLEVPTLSDSNDEPIENFRVNLSWAYAAQLGAEINPADHYAAGTIYDGPTLRIAAPKGPATEGDRLKFPVTLGVAAATDISVAWKTESLAAHSAEAGKDYTAASGTLRFKAGETTKVIRVTTLEDSIDEPAEDFSVVLTDPKVAGLDLGPLRAVGIVRDNDKRPAITIGDATANEGETLNLPITLNPAPAVPMRLEWRVRAPDTHGATRGMDYTGAESGQLTFNAGESSKRLVFPTIDDSIDEPTETFEVALIVLRDEEPLFFSSQRDSAQTDILAPLTATATILDNDTPSLSIDDVEVKEGGKPVVFTVRLSSPRTYPVEVEFSTRDGGGPRVPTQIPGRFVANTALGAGSRKDYEGVATPRTVRFEPGTTQVKLPPIRVVDDHLPENSEYFQGVIAFKSGVAPKATIAEGVGLARIQDNDTTRYWIANKDTTIREGRDVRIRVKRDRTGFRAQGLIGCLLPTGRHDAPGHAGMLARGNAAPSARIDVFIERKNNPVSVCGQATDGAIPARFSFEADEDEASFWVSTVNDRRKEPDETFIVWFDPTTASGGDETSPRLARSTDEVQAQTVFTILDDDDIHRFRVVSANSPWEGQDAHFDIYVDSDAGLAALKKASNPFVEIKFDADKTDTAKGGVHYTQGSLTRNFDPSSATRKSEPVGRISIPTIGDDVLDGDRTLTISIAELLAGSSTVLPFRPASGAAAATATATIRDDEAYHLSVLDAVGDEGDAAGVKVTLSTPAEQDITIRFRTREGTAKAPADFTACAAKDARCALVIPAGETEAQLRVPTTEDAVPEETEQFRVVIVEVDFANIIVDRRTAVVKIRDDDARSVAISGLADDSVPENIVWTSPTPSWTGAPDGGVAWTLEGDDAARFTIDPDTGVVTLPAQNFEAPADSDSDSVYDITVRVTDEDGNTAATALSVTVTDEVYGYLYLDARGDKVSVDPNTGLVRAEEGVSVRPSMLYGKRRFSNNSFTYDARRPDKAPSRLVVSRRLTGLGGAGAADDKDISSQSPDGAIANIGWKERDSYSRDTVTLVDDKVGEDVETFSIKYSMHVDNDDILIAIWTGSRNIISDTLKVEIIDNDTRGVTISPDTLSLEEADDPESADDKENIGTYTVVLDSQPAAGTVKVAIESGDTKAATASPSSLTFTTTTWNAPQTVTVTAVDDATDNTGDKRSVDITHKITTTGEGNDYTAVTADPVKVTVADDDAAPGAIALSVDTDSVDEGAGATTVTVTARITDATRFAEAKTVVVSIGGGTAVSGADYAAVADFDVTIPAEAAAGSASFTLTPTDDDVDEPDETIDVTGALTGATVTKATLSLTDDDTLGVTVTPTSKALTLAEADNGGTDAKENEGAYTVVLNSEPTADVTVAITNPPGSPVTLDKTSLTFTTATWDDPQTVTVTATDDNIDNAGDERAATLAHTVSGGGYGTAENFNVAVTVTDDDAAPTVSVGDAAAVAEGNDTSATTDMTFTVTLSAASGKAVTVPYTLSGTAAADDDYTDPAIKSVTIAAGQTTADIVIAVKGDTLDEPNETITVTLGSPVNATVSTTQGAGAGTGTITDDDATPVATLVLTPATIDESGATNASTVTARLSGATSAALTLTVSAGTGVTLSTNKALTIAAGATASTGTVTLTAVNNALDAADLEVTVSATASGGNGVADPDDVTLTVTDDDAAPTVSVGDAAAVAEGDDDDSADMTFTVTLSVASGKAVTVPYTLSGSATADVDYADPATKSVTIAAGDTTATITIPVTGDEVDEPNETVVVTLGAPTNATVDTAEGAGTGTGTITDDDATPTATLVLDPASITENGGVSTVTATLSGASSAAVTLTVAAAPVAPAVAGNFTLSTNRTLTIAAGATASTGAVTLTAVNNALDAADRTVTVSATAAGGNGVAAPASVTLTITDDDGAPTVSVGDAAAVAEGDDDDSADMTFTVTLSAASGRTVTVPYTLSGSATADADYADPATKSVTIAAGDTTATITIPVTGDEVDEPNETVVVTLGAPTNATVSSAEGAGTGTGTITDDDATPTATLVLDPASITENGGVSTVTATLSGASSAAVTLTVAAAPVAPAVAGDFTLSTNRTLTIAAGATASTGAVTLTAVNNALDAADRTVTVSATAAGGNGVAAPASQTLTITDDDGAPTVSVGDAAAVAEGDDDDSADMTFTVTLSAASGRTVTVPYTLSGSATADADYADPATKSVTIAAGDTTATITIPVTGDEVDEPNETVVVTLGAPTNATVSSAEGAGTGTGTITDDDATPTATLVLDPASITENGGVSTVTATLSGASSAAVTLTVAAAPVAPAVAGDFTLSTNRTLTIAAGATASTGAVTLTAVNNALDAADRTVTVSATAAGGNGVAAPASQTLTITDDDGAPTVSVGDAAAVAEGDDDDSADMTFTVTLSAASGRTVTVPYTLSGSATADADYADPATKSVTIAAGDTTATITIPVTGDEVDEPNETVVVTLGAPTNATVDTAEGAGTGTGTITDDDARGVTVAGAPLTLAEADDGTTDSVTENEGSYTVVLDSEPTATVTVAITNPDGSPVTLDKTSLTFTAATWDEPQTVTVTATDDSIDNAGDERTATLAHDVSGGGYGATEDFEVAVTVTDDDAAPTALTLTVDADTGTNGVQTSVAEGGGAKTARVTATLAGATTFATATTVTVAVGAAADSATEGTDYAAVADQTLTIAAGERSGQAEFTLTPTQDVLAEGAEAISLDGTAAGLTVTGATLSLTDDDAAPTGITLSVAPAAVGEGAGETEVTVTATVNGATRYPEAKTVRVTVGGGTATAGTDYAAVTPFDITLGAGAASAEGTFDLTPTQDTVAEGAETIDVSGAATGLTVTKATVSLTDDDTAPTLAIADASAAEGDALTFTVTRSGATGAAASVQWATAADAREGAVPAAAGADYTAVATARTLTIAAGDTTATFTVATTEDTVDEPNETFLVKLTGASGAAVTDDEAVGTITDDDDAPTGIALSVDPTSVAEDAAAAATVTVTAAVTGGTTYADATTVTVSVGDSADSAVSGTDYAAVPNFTITIPAGAASAEGTFSLDPTDDSLAEGAETLTVAGAAGTLAVTDAEVTLADDEGTPTATLALDPATIDESGATNVSTVTASLSAASGAALTLTVSAGAGVTASTNKTLTIAAGQTASTGAVTLTAIDNDVDAADLEVTVSATAAGGNGVAAPASVTLTIADDDARGVTVAGAPLTLAEADDGTTDSVTENEGSYTVVLDSEPTATVTVAITNPDGSPVTLDKTSLTFTAATWDEPQTVTVTATDDSIDNAGDERTATLAHDVSGGGYGATEDFEVAVTVTDDDAAPTALTLTVDADTGTNGVQTSVAEGGGAKTARVTATLAGATTFATATTVTVAVGAAADSATEGTDYAAVADQTLTIAAGERSGQAEFTLTPTQDVLAEGAEAISLDGTAAGLTVTGATLSLTDDDAAPTGITLSVAPAAVGEGAGETEVTVTATVNGATRYPEAKTVRVTVGGGTATAGADYTAVTPFDITIAAGAASGEADFDLTPTQDTVAEGAETIDVSGAATGLTVTKATLSLTDDDTAPSLAIADASAAEGDAVTFTVTRSGATGAAATVQWATAADAREGATPAAAGADYTAVTTARTLSFAIGDTTATFTVATTEDTVDEPDETFLVKLTGASGAAVTDDEAVGTITDDDAAPTGIALSVDPTSVAEDAAAAATVTVTATVAGGTTYAAATTVAVTVGDSADSAVSGTDYAAVSDVTITIPAGVASATGTFSLDPTDDSLAEGAETLTVSGAAGTLAVTDAEVTIADDDGAPTATLALTPATIDESGTTNVSTVTASLSSASSAALTLTVSAGAGVTLSSNKVLTIAAGQTASAGTVTLTAIDNDVDAADLAVTVSAAASGGNGVANPASVTLTITDDDTRGVTVSPNSLTLAEVDDGTTENAKENEGSYTVVLTSEPTADVTVALTAQTNSPVTLDKTSLTFTAATWDDPQTVTVTAVDDDIDNANDRRSARIVHAVSGGGYGASENFTVSVTVTDDDAAPKPTATLALDPATIDESGATNVSTVTASLSAASSEALTLTVSAGAGVTVSDNKVLTIAAGQAASTGTVTLTAIDNDVDAADLEVTVSATASGGNGVANPANVTLTITDDDEAAITLMPSSIEIPMGRQRAYQVRLSSEPSTTVKVAIEESVDGYVTCAPQELEFTSSDWMEPQTVMVAANGDSSGDFVAQAQDDEDGMDLLGLLHTASGNEYEGVKAEMSVQVLRTESVMPGSLTISVDDAEGPEGDWLEFRVHLSQPSPGGVRVKYRTTSGEAWGLRVPRDDGVNWDERDYDTVDGVLRFDVGEQEKIVRVWARADDGHYDPGETFFFDIYDPVGATLANPNNEYPLPLAPEVMGRVGINSADGKLVWASSRMSRAIGTITGEMPDPLEVSISVNNDVVTEGDDYTIIRVSAVAPYGARRSIRIPLTCGGGSAEADDFDCPTGLTIHHGEAYGQAGFEIRQDDDTDDETFTIAIGEPEATGDNGTFVHGAVASVELTVLDDDSGSVGNDPYDGLTVSIADASAQEGTEDLWFEVTLNRPAPGPVTVRANSWSGTARSPNDYQHLSREIRFEEGERMYRLPVWVHDDDIDEGSETMTVKLENPKPANVVIARAVATGTINNSDPIPGAWLARFGRTVADQAIDSVTDRLRALRTPGFEGNLSFPGRSGHGAEEPSSDAENEPSMAGAPSAAHAVAGHERTGLAAGASGAGEEMSSQMALLRQLGTGSFIHTLEADSAGGTLAWWGKGSQSQFSGRDGRLSLGGDVLTLTLGADYGRGPWIAGVGLLHSIGSGEWSGAGGGELEVSLTSVAPYAAWTLGERLQLWSTTGLGLGSLGVVLDKDDNKVDRIDTDMDWRMAAAGARGDLLARMGADDLAVAVITDMMWSETSSARADGLVAARTAVSRLRLGLEGSLKAQLEGGISFAPKLELGLRQDGGDAETGRGIYAGAGLALADPNLGISFDLEGQTLISHDDETFREWGMSASFTFDPRPDSEHGLSLSLRQDRGGPSSGGMQAVLSPNALSTGDLASGTSGGAATWAVEMGYGLPAFDERYTATPRLSYGLSAGNREYGLGWRLNPAEGVPDVTLGVLARRRESMRAPPEHGIEIEVSARW